jgi:pyruvate dehydrogenase E1 component beta subunit
VPEIQFLGFTHQAFHQIEAELAHEPGIKIVCPSNPYDAKGLLLESIRDPDPVLYLEPQRLYRKGRAEVPEEDFTIPLGQAKLVRDGSNVTLIAWSAAVELCLEAAEQLQNEGISASVLDLRTLVPLDVEGIVQAVQATGRCVVVHEAPRTGGFGAEVIATIQEETFYSLDAPIARVTGHDTPYPPGALEDLFLPSVPRVLEAVRRTVQS